MSRFSSILLVVLVLLLGTLSCRKKVSQEESDKQIIEKYLRDNNLSAKSTSSGLYYVVDAEGSGAQPNVNSTVTVIYRGTLTNGTEFDKSSSSGASFLLANTIKGWQEGIPLFKKGGKGKLLIPSALGYGGQSVGKIPSNSVLIFDIELLDVK